MTDMTSGEYEPIKVAVSNWSEAAPGSKPRKRIGCRPYTVVLTSGTPVDRILDENGARVYALVQAGGFDVVISNIKGEAQAAANLVSGLPNPVGMVLTAGNTFPTRIPGGDAWYAAAAQYPAQVTVLAVMEE